MRTPENSGSIFHACKLSPDFSGSIFHACKSDPAQSGSIFHARNWRSQYGASGLELSLLITRDTAYALSSGEWSSYTTTARFPQKQIPKSFAPYKALPKGLAQFASSKQSRLIGFSKIQKSEAVDRYLNAHAKPAKPVK